MTADFAQVHRLMTSLVDLTKVASGADARAG